MGFLESCELGDGWLYSRSLLIAFHFIAKFPDLVKFVTENLEQLPEVVHK